MPYQFTNDWFLAHRPAWERILAKFNPAKILEIGSFEGQSTCFLIEFLSRNRAHKRCSIVCIDSWQGGREHADENFISVEERFDRNTSFALAASSDVELVKLKNMSQIALINLLAKSNGSPRFDFVYIDGSHDACDVLSDAVLAMALLNPGGLMCFDDFLWHAGDQNPLHTPRLAIESFVNCYRDKIFLFDSGQARQLWLRKL